MVVCLFLFLLLGASGTSVRDSWDAGDLALFGTALAQVGMTPDEMRVDVHDREFYGGDKYHLPFFDALSDEPLKISPYTRRLTDELLSGADDLGLTLSRLQNRADYGVRVGLTGGPLDPYRQRAEELGEDALAVALSELAGVAPDAIQLHEGEPQPSYYTIPPSIRQALAEFLLAVPDILRYRELALVDPLKQLGMDQLEAESLIWDYVVTDEGEVNPEGDDLEQTLAIEKLLDTVDWGVLNTGATLCVIAAQDLAKQLQATEGIQQDADFDFAYETPIGWVVVNNNEAYRFTPSNGMDLLLSVSFGPIADTYDRAACARGTTSPVSVSIDLGGNDLYIDSSSIDQGCCSALLGYAALIDTAGNDSYVAYNLSQGGSIFGTSVLLDLAGDDSYSGGQVCQGSGTYGTGMLLDLAGDDSYECYQYGQGYGFTRGCGLLLDRAGNDTYVANDEDIASPSPQSAEHNASLSQGFGFGRRGDYNDGHSWAGGVGLLVDGGGDDSYSCGVFGQGCAYWYGVGILADKGGDDRYFGQWYCQGSGAHFALGVLQDDAGDDRYTGVMNMCDGAGHDFSLGWLEDSAGNDEYSCPNLSLGAANANGLGVFWDKAGDDRYLSRGVTLGMGNSVRPGSLRDFILTLGVFVDGGGHDTYLEDKGPDAEPVPWDFAGDGMQWTRPGRADPPLAAEKGCAVDAE